MSWLRTSSAMASDSATATILAATMWPVANPKDALGTDDLNGIRAA